MPLSDLFKRSPKKGPAQTPSRPPAQDNPFGSPELQKRRYEAAMEFVGVMQQNFLSAEGKGHAGTVLAVAAWLAGTSLYQSLSNQPNAAPGTIVLSEEVDKTWPQLLNLFLYYCEQGGIRINPEQLVLKTPQEHQPAMQLPEVQAKFQDRYNEIMNKHGLDYLEGARAGVIVCSIVFQYHSLKLKDIDPLVGAGVIASGIATGARTVPPPLQPASPAASAQNGQWFDLIVSIAQTSRDGTGSRLVIGESMPAMDEAVRNGGKYILVHPEVLKKLKETNVDVFLIYAAAMRMETGAKIPRIDFVGANVDDLLQEWNGKPEAQIPIHVRQLMWLLSNAQSLGYERKGNSWFLKQ